ncbi:hypothetical protein JCM17478_09370 [Thermopirellula anaerolimosa]
MRAPPKATAYLAGLGSSIGGSEPIYKTAAPWDGRTVFFGVPPPKIGAAGNFFTHRSDNYRRRDVPDSSPTGGFLGCKGAARELA